ncbi:MAG: hypothetical protein WA418_12060 [Bradyrhizobium sp.]
MADEPRFVKWPGWEDLDKRFEPYAIQLGWLVYSWNALHENLGGLFWVLTGLQNGKIPQAIWYSVTNDRTQRDMVKAVASVVLADGKQKEDILWVLSKAQSFEERRNNALHNPFTFMIDAEGPRLSSKWFQGHARAEKLKDKDLLQEFQWYGRSANTLAIFTRRMSVSLRDPTQFSWPERPELPTLGSA